MKFIRKYKIVAHGYSFGPLLALLMILLFPVPAWADNVDYSGLASTVKTMFVLMGLAVLVSLGFLVSAIIEKKKLSSSIHTETDLTSNEETPSESPERHKSQKGLNIATGCMFIISIPVFLFLMMLYKLASHNSKHVVLMIGFVVIGVPAGILILTQIISRKKQ
jgi:hypothetical protein